jgi:hypothetical protein
MNEDCFLCPADCGACPGCPDGFCAAGETCASCQSDCGVCSVCGNNVCEGPFETCTNCNADCGECDPLNCLEVVTCAFGCIDLMQDPPSFQLGCLGQCIAQGCADVQFFVQEFVDCAILAIGTCGGDFGCIQSECSNQFAACLGAFCE